MGTPKRKTEYSLGRRVLALLLAVCLAAALLPGGLTAPAEAAEDTAVVSCYASVDGVWHRVGGLTTDKRSTGLGGKNQRYYVTSEELETIYGPLGFSAADFAGQLYFPHTDTYDPKHIWADAPAVRQADGSYFIPVSFRLESSVYYVPANDPSSGSYFTSSANSDDAKVLADNGFYTLTILDPDHVAFSSDSEIPDVQYIFHGQTATQTLPMKAHIRWYASDGVTGQLLEQQPVDNGDGTATFTCTMDQPVQLTATSDGFSVLYNATLNGKMENLGITAAGHVAYPPSKQLVKEDGSVLGRVAYRLHPTEGSGHTVHAPDRDYATVRLDSAQVTDGKNRTYYYCFAGWKTELGDILAPGDFVSASDLLRYDANGDNTATLSAVWEINDAVGRIDSANFYISLDCEISDNMSNGFQGVPLHNFTNAVHSCPVMGTDGLGGDPSLGLLLIAPPTNEDNAYGVDAQIRASKTNPINGVYLESVPSDESVLAALRTAEYKVTINGTEIPAASITSENFTVRWYTVKYEHFDGWHVDGVLVAKNARFSVTKTFSGDDDVVSKIKENWSAQITHAADSEEERDPAVVTDYVLSLNSGEEETDPAKTGYTSYDADTDTYQWILPARNGRYYTLTESGHTITDAGLDINQWEQSFQYSIRGSADATNGAVPYPDSGVTFRAEVYADDVPDSATQTVELHNLYVQPGVLTIHKADSLTGDGIGGVQFAVSRADGGTFTLYRRPGTYSYYIPADGLPDDTHTQEVEDGLLTCDANGYIYLKLAPYPGQTTGVYDLTERIPSGYEGAETVRITVTSADAVSFSAQAVSAPDDAPEGGWLEGADSAVLIVKNRSVLLTEVTAQKHWDSPGEEQPVTVELWRNGARLSGAQYIQQLDEDNNWIYTWHDLPLYVNGLPARYSLRETWIGSTAYDPVAGTDGYADYIVTYDDPLYRETAGGSWHDTGTWQEEGTEHFATQVLLNVTNGTHRGEITFTKTDGMDFPLAGAEFTLYYDVVCSAAAATAVSDKDGVVCFTPMPAGTYYLKETAAPPGYRGSDRVYRAVIRQGAAMVYDDTEETAVGHITNESVMGLVLTKVNALNEPLAGAVFQLRRNGADFGTVTTGADGTTSLSGLPAGDYELIELTAPAGYRPLTQSIRLHVAAGEVRDTSDAGSGPPMWTLTRSGGTSQYALTVRNEAYYNLPTVGGPGIRTPVLLGTAMMCAAALLSLRRPYVGKRLAPRRKRRP